METTVYMIDPDTMHYIGYACLLEGMQVSPELLTTTVAPPYPADPRINQIFDATRQTWTPDPSSTTATGES